MELGHCRTYEMKQIDRLTSSASQPRERTSQGRPGGGGGGIPVYPKKIPPNIPKIDRSVVYYIPEISSSKASTYFV